VPFHAFPDPQTNPIHLPPSGINETSFAQTIPNPDPLKPLLELTGPDPEMSSPYKKVMFIRVAMSGSTIAPKLFLQAESGNLAPIITTPKAVFKAKAEEMNSEDYVGDVSMVFLESSPPVLQIRMGFVDQAKDWVLTWKLRIVNNDQKPSDFTFVVAGSVKETAQPWIDVSPDTLTYHALINESLKKSVQVSNKGTGVLNITAFNPGMPKGFVVSPALPLSIQPSNSTSLVITFTAQDPPPQPDGTITPPPTNFIASPADTTASISAGHNQQLSLTATTQKLEVVLLLDASGSMGWLPNGSSTSDKTKSRWGELTDAAGQFLDLLAHFGGKRGRFGIARFPEDPGQESPFDIVSMTDIPDKYGMQPHKDAIKPVELINNTPMGDGLDHVLNPKKPNERYFSEEQLDIKANRRWLILMSDGAHNSGTHRPQEFIPPRFSLAGRNVHLYAVAYGTGPDSDVPHELLQQLAEGSLCGGQVSNVNKDGTSAQQLAQALSATIKSGLTSASSPMDPSAVFAIGQDEALHEAVLTRYDARVAFMLNWNTPDPKRLRLELRTSNCELITPENAGQGPFKEVTFRSNNRSHMYLIGPDFLRRPEPGATGGVGRPRHGTWTFVITSPGGVGPDPENYNYEVFVDSTLRLETSQDRAAYFAGDPITISAQLTADGRPVTGASVSLCTTAPGQAVANWLATLNVPSEAMSRAKEILFGQDSTPLLVKKLAAKLAGLVFNGGQYKVTQPMSDPDGSGVYRATVTKTSVPEGYTFSVTATGVTDDGINFRREGKQETFVMVRPDAAHSHLDLNQIDLEQTEVTVIPRDRFGNVLLVDPTNIGGFGVVAPGARVGDLISRLDGTYTSMVTYDPTTNPAIGFQFDGQDVIKPTPLAPLNTLHYPDQVVAFEPGLITSTNQHADPRMVLGSIVGKPAGTFVSLGSGGKLAVAFDRKAIVAGQDRDMTVFVQPDADLRSYRVEVYSVESKQWVSLGDSAGVTQSFSLRTARLTATPAVRILDTSGRTRDTTLKPLATPGMSARGIGVLMISTDLPWSRDQLPDWLPWR
jgi:von Willebrand factor type A domain-containing protein